MYDKDNTFMGKSFESVNVEKRDQENVSEYERQRVLGTAIKTK